MEWREGEYVVSDERERVDVTAVHTYLTRSYWAEGIPLETVRRSVDHALNVNLWHAPQGLDGVGAAQVGFTRVITDFATFGYVGDVYVLEGHRGHGLSKWMMRIVSEHPRLQGFRRWSLLTRDARRLYTQFGFAPLKSPDRWMEKWDPEVYRRGS
jgi:GNAT superfamily N-acetyltransferase